MSQQIITPTADYLIRAFILSEHDERWNKPVPPSTRLTVIASLLDPYSPYVAPLVGHHESQQAEEARRQQIGWNFFWLQGGIELAAGRAE